MCPPCPVLLAPSPTQHTPPCATLAACFQRSGPPTAAQWWGERIAAAQIHPQAPPLAAPRSPAAYAGGITGIRQLGPHLCITLGNRLEVYELAMDPSKPGALLFRRRAFFERGEWLTAALATHPGSYVAAGDFQRGIRLLIYDDSSKRLEQLGMNFGLMQPHAVEFLRMQGPQHQVLTADAGRCVQVWRHTMDADWRGLQLVCEGQVYVGQTINVSRGAVPRCEGVATKDALVCSA